MKKEPNGDSNPRDFNARLDKVKDIRNKVRDAACDEFSTDPPETNDDEQKFKDLGEPGFASFTKALKHDNNGLVIKDSFKSLLDAIAAGTQGAFNGVTLGGGNRLLANPLNAYSFQLIGNDSHGARMAVGSRIR